MEWFKNLGKLMSGKKTSNKKTNVADKRYFVRPSDNRVLTAYKKPDGPGYVYHKKSSSGIRNVHIRGSTHKDEKSAKQKAERMKIKA